MISCPTRLWLTLLFLAASVPVAWGQPTPPASFTFWGRPFFDTNVVWVLDRSASMGWGTPTPLVTAQSEIASGINQLTPLHRFNVVAFNGNTDSYAVLGTVPATAANKTAAIQWVNAITAISSTCATDALLTAIEHLDGLPVHNSAIFFIGNGQPNCVPIDASLDMVATDAGHLRVHTLGLDGTSSVAIQWMVDLTLETGGVFAHGIAPPTVLTNSYRRGDANGDGWVNVTDIITTTQHLFGVGSLACPVAADFNVSGTLDLGDPIALYNHLFASGLSHRPGTNTCTTNLTQPCQQAACP